MIVKIDCKQVYHCKAVKYFREKYPIIIDNLDNSDYVLTDDEREVSFKISKLYYLLLETNRKELIYELIKQRKDFKYHFLIIERNEKMFKRKKVELDIHEENSVINLLKIFTNVLISPDTKKAFPLMDKNAKRCIYNKFYERENEEKQIFNYLLTIDNVNTIKARKICKKLNLKTGNDLLNLEIKDLVKVYGIGFETASEIINTISGGNDN